MKTTLSRFSILARSACVVALSVLIPVLSTVAETNGVPHLVCEQNRYDFGEKPDTETIKHEFIIRNDGTVPLVIKRVRVSCGCLGAAVGTNQIAPRESTGITIDFKLTGRNGRQTRTITVESNDPAQPSFQLWLKGIIVTELGLEPNYVNFGTINANAARMRSVSLVSRRPGVKITKTTVSSSPFSVTVAEDKQSLTVLTVPPLTPGTVRGSVRVETDHPEVTNLILPISALVQAPLTVVPEHITLQSGNPEIVKRSILIRPGSIERYQVLSVETPVPSIRTDIQRLSDGSYSISLDGLSATSELKGKSVIIRTDAEQMLEIKVPIEIYP